MAQKPGGVAIVIGTKGTPPNQAPGRKPAGPPQPDNEPDQDDMGGGSQVKPEAVDYHGEDERCDGCSMYGGGNCTLLKIQVDAGGHCEAFEATGGGMASDNDQDDQGGGYGSDQG